MFMAMAVAMVLVLDAHGMGWGGVDWAWGLVVESAPFENNGRVGGWVRVGGGCGMTLDSSNISSTPC